MALRDQLVAGVDNMLATPSASRLDTSTIVSARNRYPLATVAVNAPEECTSRWIGVPRRV